MRCPLKKSCYDAWLFDEYRVTAYEYPCTVDKGVIREINDREDPFERKKARAKRREDIIMAFWPEDIISYRREYNHRPEVVERRRLWERNRRLQQSLKARHKAKERIALPCGEDCENCPYDTCRYSEEVADELRAQIARDSERARKHERYAEDASRICAAKRERYASDPRYREEYKERERRRYAEERNEKTARLRERYATDPEYRAKQLARYYAHKDEINARKRAKRKEKKAKEAADNGKS